MTKSSKAKGATRENKRRVELEGMDRAIGLMGFLDTAREPLIADVEVAVCFADLRGFTRYVHSLQRDGLDMRVQHFLKAYLKIYARSLVQVIGALEEDGAFGLADPVVRTELRRLIVPASYKNLGDGMMIVWEIPQTASGHVQGLLTRLILDYIEDVQEIFTRICQNTTAVKLDSFTSNVRDLRMGFGLARGHAWRLDFCRGLPLDYAGSVINLASRLQGLARPGGIVAQLAFSESEFRHRATASNGRLASTAVRGLTDRDLVSLWVSKEVKGLEGDEVNSSDQPQPGNAGSPNGSTRRRTRRTKS